MIHIGKNTSSTIVSKAISAGHGQNTYRGFVKVLHSAEGARNYTQCDSLLLGSDCGAHTFPYIEVKNPTAQVEHEASTSKIGEDQLFYCRQRGTPEEEAISSGPVTIVTVISPSQPAASISPSARRTEASSGSKLAFVAR